MQQQDGDITLLGRLNVRRVAIIVKELCTEVEWHLLGDIQPSSNEPPPMATLHILGRRKDR